MLCACKPLWRLPNLTRMGKTLGRPFLALDRQRLAPLPHSENSSLLTMMFTTITTITTTIAPGGT